MLPLLFPGETLTSFLSRAGLYRRLRYRLRLLLWRWRIGTQEPEWHLLEWLVDPGRAAIDVGANYGGYAGRLAQLARRVHCFEPFPAAAELLALRLPPSVVIHCAAASDRAGTSQLLVPSKADGRPAVAIATLEADNPNARGAGVQAIMCDLIALDDVITEPVGFIKIDVEGHELIVLRGATRILTQDRPVLLIESTDFLCPEAPDHVFRFLGDRGYEGLFLFENRLLSIHTFEKQRHQRQTADGRPREPYAYNFIFLPAR
jgi:FkbM family methyltransferase